MYNQVIFPVANTVKSQSKGTTVDINKYFLKTEFTFSKSDRLYIESGSVFGMHEYDIGNLLDTH